MTHSDDGFELPDLALACSRLRLDVGALLEAVLAAMGAGFTEREAIMEYDGGMARITANRLALTHELRWLVPGVLDAACKWTVQNATAIRLYAVEYGLNRERLVAELRAYIERHFGEDAAAPLLGRAG